jgi:hypothetical protein
MHTRRFIVFAGVVCILAMLAYLFVFADAPLDYPEPMPTAPAPQ